MKIENYQKMINYVVNTIKTNYKEDLKQELNLYLLLLISKIDIKKIKNLDNYIFVSLKNKAKEWIKQENKYLEYIPLSESLVKDTYTIENNKLLEDIICKICSEEEYKLLYDFIVLEISQNKLSAKYNVSQQALSKRISKILNKIKKKL